MTPRMLALAATFALLGPHAIAHDGVRVHTTCDARASADCPAPPAPPTPPAPPALLAPPSPHSMPMPPAPPAPPPIPAVPAAAHAACAGQPEGARLTHVLRPGSTMTGVCARAGGRPVFRLREYRHDA